MSPQGKAEISAAEGLTVAPPKFTWTEAWYVYTAQLGRKQITWPTLN